MNKNKKEILLLPCYEHDIREYKKYCLNKIPTAKELGMLVSLEEQEREAKELELDDKLLMWKLTYLGKGVTQHESN
jgi:hypothetical protein|tara:strand:+ start:122 stop:349 length:228 start_codon:yes stop_codon:yes gene_type:complete